MTFGKFIRNRRLELKLTQDDVASGAGISKPYLSNIETGRAKNPPSDSVLRTLAARLQLDAGELIERAHFQRLPAELQKELASLRTQRDELRDLLEANPEAISAELAALLSASGKSGRPAPSPVEPGGGDSLATLTGCADGRIVTVTDDSMRPEYVPGDAVVVSLGTAPKDGSDCLVRVAGQSQDLLRRYYRCGEQIRLQPLNTTLAPLVCDESEIEMIARVLCRIELKR